MMFIDGGTNSVSFGDSSVGDVNNGGFGVKIDRGGAWLARFEETGAAAAYGMIILYSGNTPDGTDNYFCTYGDATEGSRFRIQSDGDCQNHDNAYGAVSDERLKTNIIDAQSQWDDMKGFRVRNFSLKGDVTHYGDIASNKRLGLVAQEAELVSPGIVNESPATESDIKNHAALEGENVKGIKYSILYMKAIKCLQEAQTRIETLETKVAALEG